MSPEKSTICGDQSVEELRRELAEARLREIATADVLRIISGSATDVQPVFDAIVRSCKRLLSAHTALVTRLAGRELKLAAFTPVNPQADSEIQRFYPLQLDGISPVVIAALERVPVVISDTETDRRMPQSGVEVARRRGYRSMLVVPMICKGVTIGTINVTRPTPGPFASSEIELLQTFADQAVIAIENARLFEEVQARTQELQESLRQQAGTADVLKTISRSAFDLQRVLDTLTEAAARLCGADKGLIRRREGDLYVLASTYGFSDEFKEWVASTVLAAGRGSIVGRVALERTTVRIPDVCNEPDWETGDWQQLGNFRSMIGVPLLRDGDILGILVLHRTRAVPFTEKQIELVESFADQAVIAIENTRLFEELEGRTRELQESLEYQTATSDVLNVISRSTTKVQPVFDAIVKSAAHLFDLSTATITSLENGQLHYKASASGHHPNSTWKE